LVVIGFAVCLWLFFAKIVEHNTPSQTKYKKTCVWTYILYTTYIAMANKQTPTAGNNLPKNVFTHYNKPAVAAENVQI